MKKQVTICKFTKPVSKIQKIGRNVAVIILAAGIGTRMKSNKAKVLHDTLDRPMVMYVVESAKKGCGG